MEEKMEARELRTQSKFLAWLENFWYHYKWHTIIGAFFLTVILVCTVQCATKESTDMTVSFCANAALGDAEREAVTKILGDICPEDVDGDGKKTVTLNQHSIFSEEQLTKLYTEKNEESGETKFDQSGYLSAKNYNTERIQNLQNYVLTGECAVWLVSEYVYTTMFDGKIVVVDSRPLSETWIYQTFDAIKALPDGMMVILTRPPHGTLAEDENFALAQGYFNALVNGD